MLREDIALIVCEDRNAIEAFDNGEPVNIPSCNDRADQILNLKLGKYTLRELERKADRVAILAENQELPDIPENLYCVLPYLKKYQKEIWNDNFKRIEVKDESKMH